MWNWRVFFLIVGKTSFKFFSTLYVFPKLSFGQSVLLAFIAHFGLRKAVSRAETRFAMNGKRENGKSLKLGLFQI